MTEELPKNVRMRVQMAGIQVDVRSDGVNQQLALSMIEMMIENVKERCENDE